MYFILTNYIHMKFCYLIEVSVTISEDSEAPLENNLTYYNVEISWLYFSKFTQCEGHPEDWFYLSIPI